MSRIKPRSCLKSPLPLMELKSQLLSSQLQSNGFSFLTSALSAAQRLRQQEGCSLVGYVPHISKQTSLTDGSSQIPASYPEGSRFSQLGSVLYQRELKRRVISIKNRKEQQNDQNKTSSEQKNRERRIFSCGEAEYRSRALSQLMTRRSGTL